jgi:regulator of protease activity HflC (stomatin/prohibitin superfamily)
MANFAFLSLIGFLLLLALVLYVIYIASQRAQGRNLKFSVVLIAALGLGSLLLNALGRGLTFIPPQERGLVLSLTGGYRKQTLGPGIHFVAPFFEWVKTYSIGQQAYTMSGTTNEGQVIGNDSVTARTSDGQEVFIDATVQYQVDEDKIIDLYVKWQDRYEEGLVRPRARSVVYDEVARFRVEEVYSTKRDVLQAQISDQLRKALEGNGLKLTSFLLRNITFNKEYADSVEKKQVAQQEAERGKFLVEQERQEAERVRVKAQGEADAAVTKARGDAEAKIIAAKADAEALRQISAALKENPDLLTYRYIEKIAPTIQTMLLPAGQSIILDPKSLIQPK